MRIRTCSIYVLITSVGRGDSGTSPPPEIGKIVVEIRCYLPEVYSFGAEPEMQAIFSKNVKKSIFHRDFDQKMSKFS